MLAPVSPRSVRVRAAQTATAEQLTRQLAGVVDANSNLQQQLLQFQLQHMADQRRIEQLEQLLSKAPPEPRPPGPPILEGDVLTIALTSDAKKCVLKWQGTMIHAGERGAYVDSGALTRPDWLALACLFPTQCPSVCGLVLLTVGNAYTKTVAEEARAKERARKETARNERKPKRARTEKAADCTQVRALR